MGQHDRHEMSQTDSALWQYSLQEYKIYEFKELVTHREFNSFNDQTVLQILNRKLQNYCPPTCPFPLKRLWAFFITDILTCRSGKCAGVSNEINQVSSLTSIKLLFFQVLCDVVSHFHDLLYKCTCLINIFKLLNEKNSINNALVHFK